MTNPFYPNLFSPVELGGYTLRNRVIHASIVTQYVVNHAPSEKLLNYYRSRAAGGAAAIITEPIAMTAHNRLPSRLRAWDDESLDQLKLAADTVSAEGALLMGQVQDSGRGRHSVGRNDGAVGASAAQSTELVALAVAHVVLARVKAQVGTVAGRWHVLRQRHLLRPRGLEPRRYRLIVAALLALALALVAGPLLCHRVSSHGCCRAAHATAPPPAR